MSHLEIDNKIASMIETNLAEITISDTMHTEALELYKNGLTPQFEIVKLKKNS
jgi:hypothetical protein